MTTKTPKIPPGCPYFIRKGDELFKVPAMLKGHTEVCIGMSDPPQLWRPVIAAVARCAWLEIAEPFKIDWYPTQGGMTAIHPDGRTWAEAMTNADAWAKWGRGESFS